MKYKWYDRGFIPSYIGLFKSVKVFKKYLKKHAPEHVPRFDSDGHAHTHAFYHKGKHMVCVILDLNEDQTDPVSLAGLIAHECVHVKQFVFEHMNEEQIGVETEAYFVQCYTQQMTSDYLEWMKK